GGTRHSAYVRIVGGVSGRNVNKRNFSCGSWAGITPTLSPRLFYPRKAVALAAAAKVFSPVPIADVSACSEVRKSSLDNVIGLGEERGRDCQPQSFCGVLIDK